MVEFLHFDRLQSRLKHLKGEGVVCLRDRVEVTFPRNNDSQRVSIARIEKAMADTFGGTTATEGNGCWVNPATKEKECEPVTVIASSHDCSDKAQIRAVLDLVGTEGQRHDQSTVAIRGTQRFYIVPPALLREEAPQRAVLVAKAAE